MTISLDEQIEWMEDLRKIFEACPVVADAVVASLRRLQERTTALEECVRVLEREGRWVEDGRDHVRPVLLTAAQRARQALETREGT